MIACRPEAQRKCRHIQAGFASISHHIALAVAVAVEEDSLVVVPSDIVDDLAGSSAAVQQVADIDCHHILVVVVLVVHCSSQQPDLVAPSCTDAARTITTDRYSYR